MQVRKALNVAVVGGGPGCKAIMDIIFAEKLRMDKPAKSAVLKLAVCLAARWELSFLEAAADQRFPTVC
jgi:hypothetical protein